MLKHDLRMFAAFFTSAALLTSSMTFTAGAVEAFQLGSAATEGSSYIVNKGDIVEVDIDLFNHNDINGNPLKHAAMNYEVTYDSSVLKFNEDDSVFCLTGGSLSPVINGMGEGIVKVANAAEYGYKEDVSGTGATAYKLFFKAAEDSTGTVIAGECTSLSGIPADNGEPITLVSIYRNIFDTKNYVDIHVKVTSPSEVIDSSSDTDTSISTDTAADTDTSTSTDTAADTDTEAYVPLEDVEALHKGDIIEVDVDLFNHVDENGAQLKHGAMNYDVSYDASVLKFLSDDSRFLLTSSEDNDVIISDDGNGKVSIVDACPYGYTEDVSGSKVTAYTLKFEVLTDTKTTNITGVCKSLTGITADGSDMYSLISEYDDITDNKDYADINVSVLSRSEDTDTSTAEDTDSESGHTPGDVNGDGKVNMKDLTRLHQYINGWQVEVVEEALDINGDGKVNMKDLTRLHQYLNGWDVTIV